VRDYFDPLPAGTRTIAHDLRDRGYATGFFGKWHLGSRDPTASLVGEAHARTVVSPENRGGFDYWEGFESGFLLNDPILHGTELPTPTRFSGYQSDVVCARAERWMRRATRPWFCVVSLEPPHPPYDAPSAEIAPVAPAEIKLPANVPRGGAIEARARHELSGYYAHIAATERAIARLLDTGPGATALAVITSVHGDMHGAHGLFRKGWPHEESVRVPLLLYPGGRGDRYGYHDPHAVSLLDLPRWARAWADGVDLITSTSAASRDAGHISMPSVVHLPDQCDRVWRGVRTPTRKLVLNADGSPWLFFDLERDPLEQTNLVEDPARAAELRRLAAEV
jgi:arylsulfatase A-like enzyme